VDGVSLFDCLSTQLTRLSAVVGTDPAVPIELVADLLGPAANRSLDQPSPWPSDVADDHSPVEYSIAFNETEPPTRRPPPPTSQPTRRPRTGSWTGRSTGSA
jgi:hypothetical protein